MVLDRVFNEDAIFREFGDGYDQPNKEEPGFAADGLHEGSVYRHLTDWYLVDTAARSPDARVALPDSCKFTDTYVLRGRLQSVNDYEPIQVELRHLSRWCLDRTHELRGYWVEATQQQVWYRLKEPHETQQKVHLPLRAKLGLVSNIIDVFWEEKNHHECYYQTHKDSSYDQVFKRLSCEEDDLFNECNVPSCPEYKTPWDNDLLESTGGKEFVIFVMKDFVNGFNDSVFFKSLESLTPKRLGWDSNRYEESALLAEKRSRQYPWGEPLSEAPQVLIQPNWVIQGRVDRVKHNLDESPRKQQDDVHHTAVQRRRIKNLPRGKKGSEKDRDDVNECPPTDAKEPTPRKKKRRHKKQHSSGASDMEVTAADVPIDDPTTVTVDPSTMIGTVDVEVTQEDSRMQDPSAVTAEVTGEHIPIDDPTAATLDPSTMIGTVDTKVTPEDARA